MKNKKLFFWFVMVVCAIQLSAQETASHVLSFKASENKDMKNESKSSISNYKDMTNESKSSISTYETTMNGITKPIKEYSYTNKTLLEIYQLVSQDIPQSKFILSEILTGKRTKLLATFNVEIQTIRSTKTVEEILRKLDTVSGLQTNISKVEIDTFVLKSIKENKNLKKIQNDLSRKEFVIKVSDNIIKVNGQMSSEDWLSLIKKQLNMPISLDKSLENCLYQANDVIIKMDFSSTDRQLILLEEAGLILTRESEPITVIYVQ